MFEKYEADIRYSEKMQAIREGKAEGKAEGILDLLEDHGSVPKALHDKIMEQKDILTLKNWLKMAGRADSIEEFAQRISE